MSDDFSAHQNVGQVGCRRGIVGGVLGGFHYARWHGCVAAAAASCLIRATLGRCCRLSCSTCYSGFLLGGMLLRPPDGHPVLRGLLRGPRRRRTGVQGIQPCRREDVRGIAMDAPGLRYLHRMESLNWFIFRILYYSGRNMSSKEL